MAYEMNDFRKDVIEPSQAVPVVLDFWAGWCGPCKVLGPILEKLAGEAHGRWKLVKIDTEQHPQLAMQFGIRGIPAVKMVFEKKIIAEFEGALPEPAVRKWLSENLPPSQEESGNEELIARLLEEGDRKRARKLVERITQSEPENQDMAVKLAMLLLPGDTGRARKILEKTADNSKYEIERDTLDTVEHLKDLNDDKKKTGFRENGMADHYFEGIHRLFHEDFPQALEHFLDCLNRDRTMDDDGPRKACVAIFTMLGNEHPLTRQYRRRFSMALY